ncbi:MAG: ATP-binding cassette domain-containing protein [Streptosporangiales bacterium]|nr:ATP-binding cassette domain-containing protein [Streptosporangiales bacterium]
MRAVDRISFRIDSGEVVGYIGPNGAGKSTTVKMLTGILTPSAGHIRVAGLNPVRQRVALARRIGVVFGQRTGLWWDLPLTDSFELLRHLHRIPSARYRENLELFTELLDLGAFLHIPVRQLSLGQRMRGDLTAALLHDPRIVYLDEPTIGLDVVSKAAVRSFLAEINRERGTTVLLTTHDLDDIERLCGRVMVIAGGRLVYDGSVDGLRGRVNAERTLVVDLAAPAPRLDLPAEPPGARVIRVDGPRQWVAFPATASAAPLITAITARHEVVDISLREPDIDEVVRRLYLGGLRSSAAAASSVGDPSGTDDPSETGGRSATSAK